MNNDLLTVEQVAEKLELHPKTIRRFIQEGKLKARKIGKQWRIAADDLHEFTGNKPAISFETGGQGNSLIGPDDTGNGEPLKIQVSTVIDIQVAEIEEVNRISNTLLAVMNCKDPSYGNARCDHVFYKNEMKVRYILWGSPQFISNILSCITAMIDQ